MKRILKSLFLALAVVTANSLQADHHKSKPNIVLIISDDQSWTDYGFMGHQTIETPHLDKLASESVLFRRGYVPTALCRPSLMTLATGRYAHVHGVTGNDPSRAMAKRGSEIYEARRAQLISYIEKFDTLPELLGEQGYLSHQSGKWWEGSFKHGGFTHGMTRGYPERGGRHGDDGLNIGRQGMKPIADFVDHAVDEKKPFFLWYAPFLPHTPHTPPQRLFDKYKTKVDSPFVAKYYAMCDWFDETCGELVKILEDRKIRDNTLIVYVCDNGWIQNPARNGYDKRSKQTPYEGGIRQPIFFNWPGKLKSADRKELVSSIDLFPTIVKAAGARMPEGLPGLDLWSTIKEGSQIKRKGILGEGFAHDIKDIENPEDTLLYRWTIEGRWKLLLTYDGEVAVYKTTHPRDEKRPQLFDLLKDPHEKKNVAGANPDVVARLVKKIDAWYPVTERKVLKKF
jgi:arylsulfatase A-like enzyme